MAKEVNKKKGGDGLCRIVLNVVDQPKVGSVIYVVRRQKFTWKITSVVVNIVCQGVKPVEKLR